MESVRVIPVEPVCFQFRLDLKARSPVGPIIVKGVREN